MVILGAPFEHRGDKCNAEAPAPVTAEVRQARALVVLVFWQIRICELGYRDEHESVAEALKGACKREVRIVSLSSKSAVVPHRECCDRETRTQKAFGTNTRNDSHHKGSQNGNHRSSRAEDQTGISRGVAEERLHILSSVGSL